MKKYVVSASAVGIAFAIVAACSSPENPGTPATDGASPDVAPSSADGARDTGFPTNDARATDSGTDAGDAGSDTGGDASDSGSETGTDASDSGSDTGASDTGSDAPIDSSAASCTGHTVNGQVASMFTVQGQPSLPITIQWNGCAATAQAVAASPFPTWSLTIGSSESYFRTTAAGFHTTLTQYVSGTVAALVPAVFLYSAKTLPAFNAAKGHVIVILTTVKAACGGTKAGSTVTAGGHAEAVVTYMTKDGVALGGAGMDSDGFALISNLDPAVSAEVTPMITVSGGACTMKTVFFTNRAPVVANTVATFQAQAE